MAHPEAIPEGIEVPTCQHATGYIRGRSCAEADPAAFGRLLNFIADRGVSIWFDEGGMYWRASEEDVDAELLRLLRQCTEALRQAWGPDTLPVDDPDEKSGTNRRPTKSVAPVSDAIDLPADSVGNSGGSPPLPHLCEVDVSGWKPLQ
jgi:hypothetical protein